MYILRAYHQDFNKRLRFKVLCDEGGLWVVGYKACTPDLRGRKEKTRANLRAMHRVKSCSSTVTKSSILDEILTFRE
jgi:hypothetical protein